MSLRSLATADLLGSHLGAFHARRYLLERDVPGHIWRSVFRLHIEAERGEATVIRRAQALDRNVFRCEDEIRANFLRGLDPRV
jgi:hypothetical protein